MKKQKPTPQQSCGALKSKTYFHVVIPVEAGIQSFQSFLDSRFRRSDSDLGFLSNPLNHFAFGDPVFIRPAELSSIQEGYFSKGHHLGECRPPQAAYGKKSSPQTSKPFSAILGPQTLFTRSCNFSSLDQITM